MKLFKCFIIAICAMNCMAAVIGLINAYHINISANSIWSGFTLWLSSIGGGTAALTVLIYELTNWKR